MPDFPKDLQDVNEFRKLIGEARFAPYLKAANGDEFQATINYRWNSQLSQAFYLPVQIWEICLRNQMNKFLSWKYNGSWPYDDRRAVRQLQRQDQIKLQETRFRQERERKVSRASTDSIVADLTAGFWVSQLSKKYENPYAWRYNLIRVFPNAPNVWRIKPTEWSAAKPHALCEDILKLRNRIAHHEPIFHLKLSRLHFSIGILVAAMSNVSFSYLLSDCTVQSLLKNAPATINN